MAAEHRQRSRSLLEVLGLHATVLGTVGVLCLAPGMAHAESVTLGVPFASSGQSMWGTGPAVDLPPFSDFYGIQWKTGGTFGGILEAEIGGDRICAPIIGCFTVPKADFGDYGVSLTATSEGRVGFTSKLNLDTGSVAVNYPIRATLQYPDPLAIQSGAPMRISSGFAIDTGARLSTESPRGTAGASFDFELSAKLDSKLCFVDCARDTPVNVDVDKSLPLIDVSSKSPTTKPLFGGIATITAKIPDIVTSGGLVGGKLVSGGTDSLLSVDIDVDRIATTVLGLPPLGARIGSDKIHFSYNIIDIRAGADLNVTQAFAFQAEPWVQLDFSTPVTLAGDTTSRTRTLFPMGSHIDFTVGRTTTAIDVTPTFFLKDPRLTNETSLSIDPTFSLKVLEGSIVVDLPGSVNKFIDDIDVGFGPLYSIEKTTRGPAVDIFSRNFELGGFAPIDVSGFEILANPLEVLSAFVRPSRAGFAIPGGGFTHDIAGSLVLTVRNHSAAEFHSSTLDLRMYDEDFVFGGFDDRFTRLNDLLLALVGRSFDVDIPAFGVIQFEIPFMLPEVALNDAIDRTIFPLPRPDEGDFLDVFGSGMLRFVDASGRVAELGFIATVPEPATLMLLVSGLAISLRLRHPGRTQ